MLKHTTDEEVWNSFSKAERKEFLEGYMYCVARNWQERMLGAPDLVDVYNGPNVCPQCATWQMDLREADWRRELIYRPMPIASHIDKWVEWRAKTPKEVVAFAKEVLSVAAPKIDHKEVAAMDRGLQMKLAAICYWDVTHVIGVAECVLHSLHPKEKVLYFPCDLRLAELETVSKAAVWLQGDYNVMYITVNEDGHNALLEIEKPMKQVIYYDGYENRREKKTTTKDRRIRAANDWFLIVRCILKLLGELKEGQECELELEEARTITANPRDEWKLVSASLRYPKSEDCLLAQNDTYSCGAIALIHLMKALSPKASPSSVCGRKTAILVSL